jgi:hypothetical protein
MCTKILGTNLKALKTKQFAIKNPKFCKSMKTDKKLIYTKILSEAKTSTTTIIV